MHIGFVGLGRMGNAMVQRIMQGGHKVTVFDRSPQAVVESADQGAQGSVSLADLVQKLPSPKIVWLMIPAGKPVEQAVVELTPLLSKGDIIIDGGNSNYKNTIAAAQALSAKGIYYIDAGTSGGVWGLKNGYCMMVGGDKAAVSQLEPVFKTLAPKDGYQHVGPPGAGHFVKMVHNGIEYGMMQAYAEGFEIMKASGYNLDLGAISHLWNQGSVVRSWLLELAEDALSHNPSLEGIAGYVEDSGEGRWTVEAAIEHAVPAPVITMSLLTRFRSRQPESFGAKVLAALRNEFGGHAIKKD